MDNLKNVERIKPCKSGLFTNYIFKAIPLAFDESLSYYEALCGLLSYLKDTVIPTVNNNADAVLELQTLYVELKNYVDNYFTNLDVQQEINNKLDEMVKDGTFDTIINQTLFTELNEKIIKNTNDIANLTQTVADNKKEIETSLETDILSLSNKTVHRFDTVQDMLASNLTTGNCICLGYHTKFDNIPVLYTIVENTDLVVNGGSCLQLNNNYYAIASLSGGVTPETFGISENDTKDESIQKWTTYQNYVNSKTDLFFRLLGKTYTIYKAITVGANFIGMGRNRTIIKAGDTIPVVSAIVQNNTVSKGCLLYYSNSNIIAQQTKTFGFTLNCDNKCDCGIFLSEGAFWNTENIEILNSIFAGIYTVSAWQCNWKMINIDHTTGMGIMSGGIAQIGLTTQTYENISCQGHNTAVRGYYIVRNYYSKFINCSADNYSVNSFRCENCKSLSGNIGCEYITGPYAFFFTGCDGNLDIYTTQATPSTALIALSSNVTLTLNIFFWNSTISKLIELGTGQIMADIKLEGNITNTNVLTGTVPSESTIFLKRAAGMYYAYNSLEFTRLT